MLKRTCHFVTNTNRRRVLYIALVRSQFEHFSPIWRPCGNTMINKFEKFQKKCIKWILSEQELSYSHLDNLSFVSNIALTTTSISNLNKSFFFRSHTLWNFLPFDLSNLMRPSQFKIKLVKHYWNMAATDNKQPEDEWYFQSSD